MSHRNMLDGLVVLSIAVFAFGGGAWVVLQGPPVQSLGDAMAAGLGALSAIPVLFMSAAWMAGKVGLGDPFGLNPVFSALSRWAGSSAPPPRERAASGQQRSQDRNDAKYVLAPTLLSGAGEQSEHDGGHCPEQNTPTRNSAMPSALGHVGHPIPPLLADKDLALLTGIREVTAVELRR